MEGAGSAVSGERADTVSTAVGSMWATSTSKIRTQLSPYDGYRFLIWEAVYYLFQAENALFEWFRALVRLLRNGAFPPGECVIRS